MAYYPRILVLKNFAICHTDMIRPLEMSTNSENRFNHACVELYLAITVAAKLDISILSDAKEGRCMVILMKQNSTCTLHGLVQQQYAAFFELRQSSNRIIQYTCSYLTPSILSNCIDRSIIYTR